MSLQDAEIAIDPARPLGHGEVEVCFAESLTYLIPTDTPMHQLSFHKWRPTDRYSAKSFVLMGFLYKEGTFVRMGVYEDYAVAMTRARKMAGQLRRLMGA
jgi:hypothetical protein